MIRARGKLLLLTFLVLLSGALGLLSAQEYAPPPSKKLDAAVLKAITAKTERLVQMIRELRNKGVSDARLADVEIFHHAAVWIVLHDEFFDTKSADWTQSVLDDGILRAVMIAQGDFPWTRVTGATVVRGYHSRIDGGVQPYAVTLPADYGKDPSKRWRLDVVLHGRDKSLNEVKFLKRHSGVSGPKNLDHIRLDIYGRGNNAYRWAGETDVVEVLAATSGALIDPARVVLRGFSMGGAGSWHLGLQHPSRWCVVGPGAGFSTTHGYIKNLGKLPDYQEKCLTIYDAVDYADNVFNVPVVAYGGSLDPQLQAAKNIEAALKNADFPYQLKVLVGPGLKHEFPSEWQQKAEAAYAPFIEKGRQEYPQRVRFVTYTLRYPSCDWVEILSLERHFEKALVDAEKTENGFIVKTANVHSLHLTMPPGTPYSVPMIVDAQTVTAKPWVQQNGSMHVYLQRRGKDWASVLPQRLLTERARFPRKSTGLQGPIDDAFMDSFLCVRGTGKPWHEATQKYAEANLQRFADEWSKFWRAELPVKDDVYVTTDEIATRHLILFGDPSSNSLIADVVDGLPLQWTRQQITFGGKSYAAAEHVPVMIYPSPLNAARYVVLNSGHTFHAADYLGTNALLYPRLGDYAVLRPAPTERDALAADIATAGLFDDAWNLSK